MTGLSQISIPPRQGLEGGGADAGAAIAGAAAGGGSRSPAKPGPPDAMQDAEQDALRNALRQAGDARKTWWSFFAFACEAYQGGCGGFFWLTGVCCEGIVDYIFIILS